MRYAARIFRRAGDWMTDARVTSAVETPANPQATLVCGLSLLDSVLLLVSGIIGSSIFLTAKDVAGPLPQPTLFLLVWVIGGVISLFGCVAFAESGSMFPESGGQYVYLREAYGDLVAFLYGWMLFAVANCRMKNPLPACVAIGMSRSSRARSNIQRSVPVGASKAMSPGRQGTNSLFSGAVNLPMSSLQSWATACASSSRHSCTLSSEPSVPTGIRPMENGSLPLQVTVAINGSYPTGLNGATKR